MKSILNDILEDINMTTDIKKIKRIFIKRIKESKIKEKDKNTMLKDIHKKNTYFKVMKFIYDCLLKYEGEGIIKKSLNGYKIK